MDNLPKTKKPRLVADFTLYNTGGWGGRIKPNDNDWKFQRYKGTNLGYDMICEAVNSDQEEKEGDVLNGNRIINLNNFITNIDTSLVCKECAQERELQKKLEEERDVEKFIDYVEACFQLTSSDEQKVVRELHQEYNKQTYNCQTISHQDSFCMSISEHSNGLDSTIDFKCNRKNRTNSSATIISLFISRIKLNIILVLQQLILVFLPLEQLICQLGHHHSK